MAPETWPFDGGESVTLPDLAADILAEPDIEGLTISGGEPFEQAPTLAELIDAVRAHRDLGVIVYTGYRIEDLESSAISANLFHFLLDRTDLLIDGPYEPDLDDGRSLRGSSNQRVLPLTPRYASDIERLYGVPGRKVEMFMERKSLSYAGIPPAAFSWSGSAKISKGVSK